MNDVKLDEELAATRDGLTQLRRRWRPSGDGSPRSAVALVHGIGEHSGRYDHVGRYLAARGHDVLAFDNRGHGQSGGRRGHVDRFEQYLDDIDDVLAERRELGLPVVLFGHSLGGLMASSYAVSTRPAPDLLVLSSPSLAVVAPRWQRALAPILSRLAPRLFVPSSFDPAILADDAEVQRAYKEDPLRVGGATARLGDETFRTMEATTAAVERITTPTYVLHGSADELVPASASAPLRDLPSVTYRLWPGLRHECLNEPSHLEVLGELSHWLDGRLGPDTDPAQ